MALSGESNPNASNEPYLNEMKMPHQKNTLPADSIKRVLVVDDDASIRTFLFDALSARGFEVATASGGAEGFKQFGLNSFDLVITDCIMPDTDGWQLAALIKQVSARTPIIMVTGQNEDQVRPKMQSGDIDFLVFKPFRLEKLYEAVRASLKIEWS